MEVLYIKLCSGEDLIAEFLDEDATNITVTMPFRFIYSSEDIHARRVTLSQWIPIDSVMVQPVDIMKDDIAVISSIHGRINEYYETMANKKKLIFEAELSDEEKAASSTADSNLSRDEEHARLMMLLSANVISTAIH